MNQFKNDPMVTKFVQSPREAEQSEFSRKEAGTSDGLRRDQPSLKTSETKATEPNNAAPLETDLGALAEHLAGIADALRKSTGKASFSDPSATSERSGSAEMKLPRGLSGLSAIHADARMRRKVFGDMAREAYAVRRRRSAIFENDELFGEPAWDILLDLYIANVENKPVSVSSACIGSAAPPTTGLRWLGVLSEQGLIAREHDPEDQRRVLVHLTDKGLAAMDEYFASLGLTP
ncbi:winged helix DNA-binding protein [Qipengyuania sp. S6317L1]|uniref:MarR family winged helix-turn-helix transcriptional regulator n=1 Tax=Qipengyuania sp. S6317L1 TaxID=2926410 RepID=UPI001FF5A148|nr:winged helix DNA-binding protein [Qipengyuania sp. S6317L1]MCK0100592.1 winged helix DNA-binding protein [Qipengyuania sp. S6317L1]